MMILIIIQLFRDATVPTVSLGFMGAVAWREPHWNPHQVPIIVREYQDESDPKAERGGLRSSDHVDILGNAELTVKMIYLYFLYFIHIFIVGRYYSHCCWFGYDGSRTLCQ